MKVQVANPVTVAKRMFFLAYKASSVVGMGFLHAKDNASEDDVWNNINSGDRGGDYSSISTKKKINPTRLYADYVFGRMMKLGIEWDDSSITFDDHNPNKDYQSWCNTYPSYQELFNAAVKSL